MPAGPGAAAAGAGGAAKAAKPKTKPKPGSKTDVSAGSTSTRAVKLRQAHAAGKSGAPAPGWIDDAELLDAYDQGLGTSGDYIDDDEPRKEPLDPAGFPGGPPLPLPDDGDDEQLPETDQGSGSRRSIAPIRATGTQGDIAGVFVGFIAAAFLVNVISGRWTDWLRAKFLNETTAAPSNSSSGSTAGGSSAAAPGGLFAPGGALNTLTGQVGGVQDPQVALNANAQALAGVLAALNQGH